jgi:hypothetical protein
MWLANLNPSRLAPELREKVDNYQGKAKAVLAESAR